MKAITAIILIVGILCNTCSKLYILSDYLVNKELITIKYCVNKDKPKIKCNGKCHLRKKLNEQEKQENDTKTSLKEIGEILLIPGDSILRVIQPPAMVTTIHWLQPQVSTSDFCSQLFHPPSLA